MNLTNVNPQITTIIKEVDQHLEKNLFKTLDKLPSSSIAERVPFLKTPMSTLQQIHSKFTTFKQRVTGWQAAKDELTKKQIMNLVRLAVNISIIAAAVLGALFLTNPIAIAAVIVIAFLIHTILGVGVAYNELGLRDHAAGLAGMLAGPFLMLYQTISAFRKKIGPEPLLDDVKAYQQELSELEENLKQIKPDLEKAFKELKTTIENAKKELTEEYEKIKEEMIKTSGDIDVSDLKRHLDLIEKAAQDNMKKIQKAEENITDINKMTTWLNDILSHLSEKAD